MPKIIDVNTKKEISIEKNKEIKDSCEKLGVPFACEKGYCGVCSIEIVSGQENLSGLTKAEKVFKKDRDNRLACQCKIKEGDVKIHW